MSSLFDALEKLKQEGGAPGGDKSTGFSREDAAAMALNITPEPLSRLKWRRRILAISVFVVVPVTVAYVAHVYDETMRAPGSPSLMNRIVSFVAGEDGMKDYVRQGVGTARNVATGVVGNLDKLVTPYGNLPVSDVQVPVPATPAEPAVNTPSLPQEPVVQETMDAAAVSGKPAVTTSVAVQAAGTSAPGSSSFPKPPALPGVDQVTIDQLIGDLATDDGNPAFSTPATGAPLPAADSALPDHVEMRRGKAAAITGEDVAMSVGYKRSIALRGLYESARAALDGGDNVQAIALFGKILDYNREDDVAWFALAVAQQKAGRRQDALASYKRLLALDPQNLEAQANRLALIGQDDPAEALGQMEALVRNNPDFVAGWSQLSDLYAGQDNLPAAIAARRQVLALRPNNLADLYNLAVLYDRHGDRDAAISTYRAVLRAAGNGGEGLPLDGMRQRLGYLVQ